jgi:hypothetical protein
MAVLKYRVKAYNHDATIGPINLIEVVVYADSEEAALQRASGLSGRTQHAIIGIEDMPNKLERKVRTTSELKKSRR